MALLIEFPRNNNWWIIAQWASCALILLSFIWISTQVIYNIYFHPLSVFPGPKTYAASRLPYVRENLNGRLPFTCQKLHSIYGEIVRIAPDELSFTSPEAWKDIYGHRPGKSQLQKDLRFYGLANVPKDFTHSMITADNATHARYRRLLAHAFSDKAMREQEPLIKVYVDLLIAQLGKKTGDGEVSVDIVAWYNWTTFDIFGDLAFGEPFRCLDRMEYHPWVLVLFESIKAGQFLSSAKRYPVLERLLGLLIPKSLLAKRAAHQQLVIENVAKRKEQKTDRADFMTHMLKQRSDGNGMSDSELASNSNILIFGGSETTATLMSAATYYLLQNPPMLKRLVDEVRDTFDTEDKITIQSTGSLKYLAAVLDETLRIYPPVPIAGPRVVGPEGDTVNGKFIPAGTTVSISQWVINHSPENFTLPDSFVPERFLDDPLFASDRQNALQPFSTGPRNCIGRSLAYAEMRLILARIFWNFDLELAPESEYWTKQKVFILWEKGPLNVKVRQRS